MLKLCRNPKEPASAFKQLFPEELIAIAEENPNVIAFDADLANASGLRAFADRFPERFFECGIQRRWQSVYVLWQCRYTDAWHISGRFRVCHQKPL